MSTSRRLIGCAGGGEPIIGPDFIVTISNGGTKAFTYDVDTETLTDVTSTYIPSGSPSSAGGYESINGNPNGTKFTSTGWYTPLRCATFDTSTTPFTMTSQGGLPIGSSGNRLGGCPSVNSRGTITTASSQPAAGYYSSATGNSWTSFASGSSYSRHCSGHNRTYVAYSNTALYAYRSTGAPSYLSGTNTGSSDRLAASERTYDPTSYTDPAQNEVIAISGAQNSIVIYDATAGTYSLIRRGVTDDGIAGCAGAGVTADGTRVIFGNTSNVYVYDVDPDAKTASLLTTVPVAGGAAYSGDCDIFPSGNAFVTMSSSTLYVYDIDGNLLDSIGAGTYGCACLYDGVNATA